MGKKWSMHGKGMDHFGKENCDSPLVIGEREEERKEKLTSDATHGSLALKAYQQNLYLKYYY